MHACSVQILLIISCNEICRDFSDKAETNYECCQI